MFTNYLHNVHTINGVAAAVVQIQFAAEILLKIFFHLYCHTVSQHKFTIFFSELQCFYYFTIFLLKIVSHLTKSLLFYPLENFINSIVREYKLKICSSTLFSLSFFLSS